MLKLKRLTVPIDNLLLDPNNPRLVTALNIQNDVPDDDFEASQAELLGKFTDSTELLIDDLKDSMCEIGYVGIDRIVVRKLDNGKFVVLEGNRRTATIKILRDENAKALPQHKLKDHVAETFKELEVMELQAAGLSRSELNEKITVLLGLRHYGSLLEWEPLPKAFNMYHNYMQIDPPIDKFVVQQSRIKEVASRLSIRQPDVRRALRTYIAYLQLSETFNGVKEKYYSLIEGAISNKNIAGNGYLNIDGETYELDEASKQRLDQVCQFDRRDDLPVDQIIVRRPQDMKLLGDLVKRSKTGATEATRAYAESLLKEVESGEIDQETRKLMRTLESAVDSANDFEATTTWVSSINQLLEKQDSDLNISDYKGIGNDLIQKERVESSLELLVRIYAV